MQLLHCMKQSLPLPGKWEYGRCRMLKSCCIVQPNAILSAMDIEIFSSEE